MALTAAKLSASPNRLVYSLTGDGAATSATIASATLIADAVAGPLKDLLSASYGNQAAMRAVFGHGTVRINVAPRTLTTINIAAIAADVDTDATTATRPEVNVNSATAAANGDVALLTIEFQHSLVQ